MARLANYTEKWFFIHLFFIYFKVFIIIVILVWFWFWFLVFILFNREERFIYIFMEKKRMETGY